VALAVTDRLLAGITTVTVSLFGLPQASFTVTVTVMGCAEDP
jgi:hypothetical protein